MYNSDYNAYILYANSLLHYGDKKEIPALKKFVYIYYLDKRFLLTNNLKDIQSVLPTCNIKDHDAFYIRVISSSYISQSDFLGDMLRQRFVPELKDFRRVVGV